MCLYQQVYRQVHYTLTLNLFCRLHLFYILRYAVWVIVKQKEMDILSAIPKGDYVGVSCGNNVPIS